jgi:hypothetical protein
LFSFITALTQYSGAYFKDRVDAFLGAALVFCLNDDPHYRFGITGSHVHPAIVEIESTAVSSLELCAGEGLFWRIENQSSLQT